MRLLKRFAPLALFLTLAIASPPPHEAEDAVTEGTVFNGKEVPPCTELSGGKVDESISKGFWFVEFFSPYCHHCKALAPTWQTLYEFYYTMDPLPNEKSKSSEGDSLNTFTRYYDFKFAKLDCVAFSDACAAKDIHSFPTIILFKDGEEVKKHVGASDLKYYSDWIEETLETIRPGSRPKEGVKLPEVGARAVDSNAKPAVPQAKDKDPAAGSAAAAKANEVASKTKETAPTATKVRETHNPLGTSISLTAESFQKLVTTTQDPWFVKFYAPWCHHCQAMAPNWAEMSRDMKGKLNVGEVNCDIEKRLCKDARVKGYPTLLFFRGGERVEYDGLRGVGDLISFANKAYEVGDGVADVDKATFEKMEETEEVIFLYIYDHATTSEDFAALERLTLSLIGHAKLVKSNDPALAERFKISTWPRLLVSRDGKASYYSALAPHEMRDFRRVLNWMKTVWLPIVPEMTSSNAREIMDGKIVVLGVLSRERSDEFVVAKREIKNAALEWIDKQTHQYQLERQELRDAKQLRIEEAEDRNDQRALRAAKSIRINMDEIERKDVAFAWVDGVFWERWIKTTYGVDVKDGEKVIINDEENHRYWDQTSTGNPIVPSRTSILETLGKVTRNPPALPAKSTIGAFSHFFFSLKQLLTGHPFVSVGVILGFILAGSWLGKGRLRRVKSFGQGGFFQVNEKEGGILGNVNGGGKVD
ncbi:thioredoxin-like protein [Saccharata proteae CBS 121410]|uniref:Thioredoxin-like protein n=1 Tax=Saccharata proteae CBS 121410 TaxID=1314787 RepID=A0A9P4I2D4_9PEZI|nr:thioredoxin-like protein [Saccharata proteae CBS 121410]